jgi:alanine-glyoxylate transaminase/serine-glyoxylate transaminase/serine-pyruvate transaminase
VYFPEGISAPDIIPRMLKQDVVVAAGLHKEVKGRIITLVWTMHPISD